MNYKGLVLFHTKCGSKLNAVVALYTHTVASNYKGGPFVCYQNFCQSVSHCILLTVLSCYNYRQHV